MVVWRQRLRRNNGRFVSFCPRFKYLGTFITRNLITTTSTRLYNFLQSCSYDNETQPPVPNVHGRGRRRERHVEWLMTHRFRPVRKLHFAVVQIHFIAAAARSRGFVGLVRLNYYFVLRVTKMLLTSDCLLNRPFAESTGFILPPKAIFSSEKAVKTLTTLCLPGSPITLPIRSEAATMLTDAFGRNAMPSLKRLYSCVCHISVMMAWWPC
jgi:hypothetical protein